MSTLNLGFRSINSVLLTLGHKINRIAEQQSSFICSAQSETFSLKLTCAIALEIQLDETYIVQQANRSSSSPSLFVPFGTNILSHSKNFLC